MVLHVASFIVDVQPVSSASLSSLNPCHKYQRHYSDSRCVAVVVGVIVVVIAIATATVIVKDQQHHN